MPVRQVLQMRTVLKLNRPNSEKEMSFEVKYLSSLSIRERFEMMFEKNREIINLWRKVDTEGLLKLLKEHKVDFVVIGATAFPVHGYARDIGHRYIYKSNRKNSEKTLAALKAFGYDVTDLNKEDLLKRKYLSANTRLRRISILL